MTVCLIKEIKMENKIRKTKGNGTVSVKLNLTFDEIQNSRIPEATAFIYDRNSKIVASKVLPQKATASVEMDIPKKYLGAHMRLFVGPDARYAEGEFNTLMRKNSPHDQHRSAQSISSMRKKSFLDKTFLVDSATVKIDDTIFKERWENWLFCKCVVRGRFVKSIVLPDGGVQYLGLSNACVCLHEVDSIPYAISRIPIEELYRLREDLRYLVEGPFPPLPDPWARMRSERLPLPTPFIEEKTAAIKKSANAGQRIPVSGILPAGTKAVEDSVFLGADLRKVFSAASDTALRHSLIEQAEIIETLLCRLTYIAGYLKKDFIKCTTTDAYGYFETTISYRCAGDKPDLYFQACQCIGGFPQMVYDPGVACHTHWNYKCGTDLTLEVTDPAAIVAAEPDPVDVPSGVTTWVMPYAIGNIRIDRINTAGLVDYDSITDAPFGGYMGLRHGFSDIIPNNALYYYRWLYKKDGGSNWTELGIPVYRHYVHEEPGKLPVFPVVTLGPKVVNAKNLYRFKPASPNLCSDVIAGGNNYWPAEDWFNETYTGFLNSTALPGGVNNAHGLFWLKLEIYDSSGNLVDPATTAFDFVVPDGIASDGRTIKTRKTQPAEIDGQGFVFTIHIDNRPTASAIDAPHIGTVYADNVCGFLRYKAGNMVSLSFHANQDNNFGMFSYWIKRGGNTILDYSWRNVSDVTAGVFSGDGNGNFDHDFSNEVLRDTCESAAFVQNLRTYAKATNGHRRLDEYDSHDEWAFALSPADS